MSDIALDLNPLSPTRNDLLIQNGDLVIVDGLSAITQDVLQRLRFYYAEWFLDVTQGIDYFNQILVKNPDQGKIDAIMINAILTTPGIIQLNSYAFQSNFLTRQAFVQFNAQSTSGPVNYAGLLTG